MSLAALQGVDVVLPHVLGALKQKEKTEIKAAPIPHGSHEGIGQNGGVKGSKKLTDHLVTVCGKPLRSLCFLGFVAVFSGILRRGQ